MYLLLISIAMSVGCNRRDGVGETITVESCDFKEWDSVFSFTAPIYLEDSANSHLGYSRQCYEDGDRIVFVDYNSKRILCFSSEGKYLYDIGRLGHSGEEYTNIRDVVIDRERHHVVVMDYDGFVRYDINSGQFVEREKTSSETFLDYWNFVPIPQGGYLAHNVRGDNSVEELCGKSVRALRKSTGQQYGSNLFYTFGDRVMVTGDYGDLDIEEYKRGGLEMRYRLNICGKNLPTDKKPQDYDEMKELSNSQYFTCILSAYETDEWLYCLLKGPANDSYHLLYNKHSGEIISGPKNQDDGLTIVGSDRHSFKALLYPDMNDNRQKVRDIAGRVEMDCHNPVFLTLNVNPQHN